MSETYAFRNIKTSSVAVRFANIQRNILLFKYVKTLFIVISIILCSLTSYSKDGNVKVKTDTIMVKGNCDMCKKTIESALEVKGVKEAEWNVKTQLLIVSYVPSKISREQIEQKVAAAGYDTENVKASDKSYHKLHSCCQYER